jgi:hypothetical protein
VGCYEEGELTVLVPFLFFYVSRFLFGLARRWAGRTLFTYFTFITLPLSHISFPNPG